MLDSSLMTANFGGFTVYKIVPNIDSLGDLRIRTTSGSDILASSYVK